MEWWIYAQVPDDYSVLANGEGDPHAIPLASWWFCEECSDLYFSLSELGFCVAPDENMRELLNEYHRRGPVNDLA